MSQNRWLLAVRYNNDEWGVYYGTARETAAVRDTMLGSNIKGMMRAKVTEIYGFRNTELEKESKI